MENRMKTPFGKKDAECVMHNNVKAKEYCKKACAFGDKVGCAEYRKIGK